MQVHDSYQLFLFAYCENSGSVDQMPLVPLDSSRLRDLLNLIFERSGIRACICTRSPHGVLIPRWRRSEGTATLSSLISLPRDQVLTALGLRVSLGEAGTRLVEYVGSPLSVVAFELLRVMGSNLSCFPAGTTILLNQFGPEDFFDIIGKCLVYDDDSSDHVTFDSLLRSKLEIDYGYDPATFNLPELVYNSFQVLLER